MIQEHRITVLYLLDDACKLKIVEVIRKSKAPLAVLRLSFWVVKVKQFIASVQTDGRTREVRLNNSLGLHQ